MNWKVVTVLLAEMLTISLLLRPTLPLTVTIVKVYDVGDVGYWNVVCLNVTNHGDAPVYPIFLLNEFDSEKRWVVSSQIQQYAPYNDTLIVVPPHSSRLVNISSPSPLYFIPPFTRVFVQVYNVSTYDFANSPVYTTPNATRPPVVNPNFSILYYSGKYREALPWGWYVELTPNTKLSYRNGITVNGSALFYQPVFTNVTVIGYDVRYTVYDGTLFIYVHNGYVEGVEVGS